MTQRSSRTRIPVSALFTLLAACQAVGSGSSGEERRGEPLEFEHLQIGSVYGVGASFESDGLEFVVADFGAGLGNVEVARASSGPETPAVRVREKDSAEDAGPKAIRLAHALLRCSGRDGVHLEFDYIDRGGPVALGIGGATRNVDDFAELDGQELGGAKLAVRESSTAGVRHGRVVVSGRIERFALAGADLELAGVRLEDD